MRITSLVIILFTLLSCNEKTYILCNRSTDEIRIAVISAFEDITGTEVDLNARANLAKETITLVTLQQIKERFPYMGDNVVGLWIKDEGIWVLEGLDPKVEAVITAHEYVHSLSYIISSNCDPCHVTKFLFSCPGSVEMTSIDWLDLENIFTSAYSCGISSCESTDLASKTIAFDYL